MRKLSLVLALVMTLVAGLVPAAAAADPDTSWGTGGTATLALPADTNVADTALLADGRVVVVGYETGGVPWGAIASADGAVFTPLSGFARFGTRFTTVTTGHDRIYAIGGVEEVGVTGLVAVFDTGGVFIESHSFLVNDFTEPTSSAIDGAGRLFVAGRGYDLGGDDRTAWLVRLLPSGAVDGSFLTLLLAPPDPGATPSNAYVGATAGQAVAIVTGDNDPGPGSSIGFHRITETGSVFMADFSSARTIAATDVDSSSGQAVFGSLTPGISGTDVTYLIHSIGVTGAIDETSADNWAAVASSLATGRVRTDELLGAGESGANVFVELVQSQTPFASHSDAALADVATSPLDGAVYITMQDAISQDLVIAKYVGDDSGRFIDDDFSVHEADIETLATLGITRGCNPPVNDRYCPSGLVTRGQMAAFLTRALALPASPNDHFVDDDGSVFEDDINSIAFAGITLGCNPPTNDRYCPSGTVTRGQMAAFLTRALGLPSVPNDHFVDDDGSVFEDDINSIAFAGITLGCNPPTNDRYCPDDDVTREQMASFIVRAIAP